MELTKGQKRIAKRAIDSEYKKYIINCLKTGRKALPPDEWWELYRKKEI